MNIITSLLFSSAGDSFVKLFTEMNAWTIAVFALGLVFCIIEMCIPGFGFFGISGTVLIVVGIVLRMVSDGDLLMLVYMVLIALVLFILMFWIISRVITKGRLSKTALFHVDSAVSTGITEGTKDFAFLIGCEGTTQTLLRPVGKASFSGETVDVVARDSFIAEGKTVVVTAVEGQRVIVIEK